MPYKPRKRPDQSSRYPEILTNLNPKEPKSPYWWLVGRLEARAMPGFANKDQQYLIIDKNEAAINQIARIIGLPTANVEEYVTVTRSLRSTRFYGLTMSKEEEIDLWMTLWPDFQNDMYKERLRIWLEKAGMKEPSTVSKRVERRL